MVNFWNLNVGVENFAKRDLICNFGEIDGNLTIKLIER